MRVSKMSMLYQDENLGNKNILIELIPIFIIDST